jgi:hypothetical protein
MIITIKRIKKKILLKEKDFQKLLHTAEKVEKVKVNLEEEFDDLLNSSAESLGFWNNDIDDKIWNNAE